MRRATDPGRLRDRRIARVTGAAYLGIIATGIFAEFVVRGALVESGDASRTAERIAESPTLFKIGIGADVVMILLDVVVAVGLLRLLMSVNRPLMVASFVFRLVQGAVLAVNLLNLLAALRQARQAIGPDGSVLLGPAGDTLDAVERHAVGYDTGLIAFGLSCLLLGWVLFRSHQVGRWLAAGMCATGAVYLVGSMTTLFFEDEAVYVDPLYVIPLVVEITFAVTLLAWNRSRRSRDSGHRIGASSPSDSTKLIARPLSLTDSSD